MYLRVGLRPEKFVSLYGTTPPRADAGVVAAVRAADRLTERVRVTPSQRIKTGFDELISRLYVSKM
jgi:hypothetical protein